MKKRPGVSGGEKRVGVISDTHGVLRREAVEALRGVDHIIHAGDVGRPEIIEELSGLAPLTVVRGNVDCGSWAEAIPHTEVLDLAGTVFYVLHDLAELDLEPAEAGIAVVVSGHSHRPALEEKNGVIFLNPGSAGPRRFDLPVSLARIRITGAALRPSDVEFVELEPKQ